LTEGHRSLQHKLMAQQSSTETTAPASYRIIRRGVRSWLALSRRSVRVLGAERLPDSAAILYVCHPADFEDALMLIAALDRPVTCVVGRAETAGRQSMIESGLGMIAAPPSGITNAPAWHAALRSCTAVLAAGGLALVFSGSDGDIDRTGQETDAALNLACEAWMSAFPEQIPVIVPIHRFRPEARAQEALIHIGETVRLDADEDPGLLQQQVKAVVETVHNVFALDATLLARLMRGVERDLRERLQQQWASRPGRTRKTEGFRLSPFAAETLRRVNRVEPEALVALTAMSDAEHEARRECALAQLRAEIEIKQFSTAQRLFGWMESVVGLPVALYGAVNHLIAAALLLACGLLKRDAQPQLGPWVARGVIVFGCYAGQVALVDHFFGRAAAGYYAVTLPVSGAYLLRYLWLVQRRTRVLLAGTRGAMLSKVADKNRARFFEKLDAILESGSAGPRPAPGS
jgi:hypothetical protein